MTIEAKFSDDAGNTLEIETSLSGAVMFTATSADGVDEVSVVLDVGQRRQLLTMLVGAP